MTYYHTTSTPERDVPKVKIAITLEAGTLRDLDRAVDAAHFPNRSQAIEAAVQEKLERLARRRLARECALLDPGAEQRLADEGLGEDATAWPGY